jgi:hypothetical protein
MLAGSVPISDVLRMSGSTTLVMTALVRLTLRKGENAQRPPTGGP